MVESEVAQASLTEVEKEHHLIKIGMNDIIMSEYNLVIYQDIASIRDEKTQWSDSMQLKLQTISSLKKELESRELKLEEQRIWCRRQLDEILANEVQYHVL